MNAFGRSPDAAFSSVQGVSSKRLEQESTYGSTILAPIVDNLRAPAAAKSPWFSFWQRALTARRLPLALSKAQTTAK
jgi:hypothetical protein